MDKWRQDHPSRQRIYIKSLKGVRYCNLPSISVINCSRLYLLWMSWDMFIHIVLPNNLKFLKFLPGGKATLCLEYTELTLTSQSERKVEGEVGTLASAGFSLEVMG